MRVQGIPFVQGRNDYGPMTPSGIAIHNTSNDATAEQEASYATRRTDGVGSHFYADSNSVVQSIDTDRRTGHAGSRNGNHNSIAVEITGVNGWSREQWLDRVAWDELARVLAVCCREYGIKPERATVAEMKANPRVRRFYGHDDMRRAWGGTTHTDPGPNFPWDYLLATVEQAMNGDDDMPTADEIARAVWSRGYFDYVVGPDGERATISTATALFRARKDADSVRVEVAAVRVELAAMRSVVEALASAIQAGGGSVDTAAILAGVAVQVGEAVEQITTETRDAVADLGEGGAAQVRGEQT